MVPLLVGILAGAVYLVTQAPGLYYTDTGELAAAAHTWGVAHPTGYPLFTLIAHVWSMLPWPSVIKGLNILAAVLVAATASVLTLVVRDVLRLTAPALDEKPRTYIGAAAALLWAFSPTVWAQSTAVEVYALNTLLFVLVISSQQRVASNTQNHTHTHDQRLATRYSLLSGLLFGLMLANHLSSIFLAPGFLYWWWKMQPSKDIAKKQLGWLLAPSLLGPMMYLILPMRSATLPPINWGWVHRGWDAFVYHVKGTQFGVWMFSDSAAMRENTSTFFTLASQELLWIGWIGAVIGLVALWKTQRHMAIAMMLLIVGNLGISLGYAIPDIDAYFLPTLTILAILLAISLPKLASIKLFRPFALSPFVVVIGLISLGLNYRQMDHSSHRAVSAYTTWAMENAQPRAIIITRQWDYMCSAFWYMQTVEGVRPDVVMIDKELIRRTWYLPHLQHLYPDVMKGAKPAIDAYMPWLEQFEEDADAFTANPANNREIQRRFVDVLNAIVDNNTDRPIYITPEMLTDEQGFASGYTAVPAGPLVRLVGNGERGMGNGEWGMGHVEEVVKSLTERRTRLDSAMSALVVSNLASNAMYALRVQQDVKRFTYYRDLAMRLDPKDRTTRMLMLEQLP